jgi:hypothetical protein
MKNYPIKVAGHRGKQISRSFLVLLEKCIYRGEPK